MTIHPCARCGRAIISEDELYHFARRQLCEGCTARKVTVPR